MDSREQSRQLLWQPQAELGRHFSNLHSIYCICERLKEAKSLDLSETPYAILRVLFRRGEGTSCHLSREPLRQSDPGLKPHP